MATYDDSDTLRVCIFRPYRRGLGPSFKLTTWATGRCDTRGCSVIGYRLTMHHQRLCSPLDGTVWQKASTVVIFEAEDFSPGWGTADDSDACMAGIMTFLTLRPGDTDADYFASDTEAQRDYRDHHAEALAMAVMDRFGEDY